MTIITLKERENLIQSIDNHEFATGVVLLRTGVCNFKGSSVPEETFRRSLLNEVCWAMGILFLKIIFLCFNKLLNKCVNKSQK